MKFEKESLTAKIANYFLLLALLAVGVVGGMTYLTAKTALEKAAFERLEVAANLKEEEIERWFQDLQQDFLLATEMPDIKTNLQSILTSSEPATQQKSHALLSQHLTKFTEIKANFAEISIVDRYDRLIFSTNPKHQQQQGIDRAITGSTSSPLQKPKKPLTYVLPGQSASFTPVFYLDRLTKQPTITLAQKIVDRQGIERGTVMVDVDLKDFEQIIREKTGLGKSSESYLVGSLVDRKSFILGTSAKHKHSFEKSPSLGIDAAMSRSSGYGHYPNYAKFPVFGVYHWLDGRNLALLVEISQNEAILPARQLASAIISIGSISLLGLSIGVNWLSRQLSISRQQLEDYSHQLELTAQKAETANRAKSLFLANMSHELRTPLNAILGFAQLMERDSSISDRQKEFLGIINRSGEHLLNLINDVLEMSKIEAGKITLNLESFDLILLLTTIQEMFQMRAIGKQLHFKAIVSEELPRYVIGDRHKLRQVLMNLLSNAIKFTQMGEVTLKVWSKYQSQKQVQICFEVSDTGKGIAPQELAELFEPFVQTNSGIISEGGTGLGLAISRQFVRLMGGEIQVTSMLDLGSSFCFNIEMFLSESSAIESIAKKPKIKQVAFHHSQYRILVVDDKAANRQLLVRLLQAVGFNPRWANNGREAVEIWYEWQPHLIWMDMRMPLMDGYEATKYIKTRSSKSKTIVIALTASAFEEQREKMLQSGCDDFVRKPFTEDLIFEKMAQHLEIEYIYESSTSEVPTLQTSTQSLVEQDLSLLSREWLSQLHQAAIAVDSEKIEQLVDRLSSKHQSIAQSLITMTRSYDFDSIIELTEAYQTNLVN
jgi:signal transduction histidine kinase/DNA-binding response OmpR family regulator